jgi:hypothetical protein
MDLSNIGCNKINRHQRDSRCKFYPESHTYEIDESIYRSVTTIISGFFSVFDADDAIQKMKNGRNWNPGNKYWGMQDFEIKQLWEEKGIQASEQGTYLHEQIEKFYLDEKHEEPLEFSHFLDFAKDHNFLNPYRTEWRIFDEKFKIAGTIDFIAENNGNLEIYDWKRSLKVINKKSGLPITENPWDSGVKGLNDTDDTSYNHYVLQLSMYRYLLERNYGILISNMFIVVLHPKYEQYFKVHVPYKKEKVEYILSTL